MTPGPPACIPRSSLIRSRYLLILMLAALGAGCGISGKAATAPSDAAVTLAAAQEYVAADATTTITIGAHASNGDPVPDDTGFIVLADRGVVTPQKAKMQNGRASVTYRATTEHGLDQIHTYSGDLRAELEIPVTSAPIERISLSASAATLPPGGGESTITATVLGPNDARVAGAPVVLATSTGTLSTTEAIYTDERGTATAVLETSETARITGKSGAAQADISVRVRARTNLEIAAAPSPATVSEPVTFSIAARNPDGEPVGRLTVDFGDGQTTDAGRISGDGSVAHTYSTAGTFEVKAELAEEKGVESTATLDLDVRAAPDPDPPPPPSPDPDPPPPPAPSGSDELDLSQVSWLHTDVSRWAVTSRVTSVSITRHEVCINHTKAGAFPTSPFGSIRVEGNLWIFARIDGRWYGATWEWLRVGQTCKRVTAEEFGRDQIRKPPMDASWVPRAGDTIGFMASTRARDNVRAGEERSNVVLVTWPY